MIVLPWIAFLIAIIWMIRQGDKDKREYQRRAAEQDKRKPNLQTILRALSDPGNEQGQAPEVTGALAGSGQSRTAPGFNQGRN
jgi:hypothetical protein